MNISQSENKCPSFSPDKTPRRQLKESRSSGDDNVQHNEILASFRGFLQTVNAQFRCSSGGPYGVKTLMFTREMARIEIKQDSLGLADD